MLIAVAYAVVSGLFYSLYTINIKKAHNRMILFFWVNVITYLCYLVLFFIKDSILLQDRHPIEHLIHEFTLTNSPFYLLMAFFWVGSLVVLNYLLTHYEVSKVTPALHIGILITTCGYMLLGKYFSWGEIAGIITIFTGAYISTYEEFSWKNFYTPIKNFAPLLIVAALLETFLVSGSQWITFICTQKTAITEEIQKWAHHISHHIHGLPFGFHNPFYYNVGVRFFIVVVFISYILLFTDDRKKIVSVLRNQFGHILFVSFCFAAFILTYYSAFFLFQDKDMLSAISKLGIPATLVAGHFFLSEKITQPKVVGTSLILVGGVLNLIF
jgi:drug/metabolite transporter (DMT)-like permease